MASEFDRLSPQLKQEILQIQQLQQQAQVMVQQRLQMELQLKETEKAVEELSKLKDTSEIYKNIGTLLIKSEKKDVSEELAEKKETLELRIKTFKKQEERIEGKLKEMQTKIQDALKTQSSAFGSAG